MNEEWIKDEARKYANLCQFRSDFPHDWHSVNDGFIQGMKLALNLLWVINWVAIKDQLPPAGETVLLATKDQYKTEFIHEFDLITQTYQLNWLYWAHITKPPCI